MKTTAPLKRYSLSIDNYVVTEILQSAAFKGFLTFSPLKSHLSHNYPGTFRIFAWAA